jgi:hypothetical protein
MIQERVKERQTITARDVHNLMSVQLHVTTTNDLTSRYSNRVRVDSIAVQMDVRGTYIISGSCAVAAQKPMSQLAIEGEVGEGVLLPR